MREPELTLELLGWAALRLHGLEGEAYRRDALITALERLSRTPRLRRLAENPLLLTLVGLLLRAGHDVPSRRGDLYERALKLLLTRDHNAEDAAPVAPMREPELTLELLGCCLLYTSPSPRDGLLSRMPSSA